MRWQEILESPRIVGPTDWNLGDPKVNAARAREILAYPGLVTLRQYPSAKLVQFGGPHGGVVGLIRETGILDYEMRYETASRPDLGQCATQIRIWRRRTAAVSGLAQLVFEEFLLSKFDTIVSDRGQTPDGVAFWQTRMAGLHMNKTIGAIKGGKIEIFSRMDEFEDWLHSVDGWGKPSAFRYIVFFISNKSSDEILAKQVTQEATV